jgi:hypothetical protein
MYPTNYEEAIRYYSYGTEEVGAETKTETMINEEENEGKEEVETQIPANFSDQNAETEREDQEEK